MFVYVACFLNFEKSNNFLHDQAKICPDLCLLFWACNYSKRAQKRAFSKKKLVCTLLLFLPATEICGNKN